MSRAGAPRPPVCVFGSASTARGSVCSRRTRRGWTLPASAVSALGAVHRPPRPPPGGPSSSRTPGCCGSGARCRSVEWSPEHRAQRFSHAFRAPTARQRSRRAVGKRVDPVSVQRVPVVPPSGIRTGGVIARRRGPLSSAHEPFFRIRLVSGCFGERAFSSAGWPMTAVLRNRSLAGRTFGR